MSKVSAEASTRRNVGVLCVAQAFGGATPAVVISLGGIVGYQLSPDKSLATLPVSMMQLGLAVWTLPLGWLVRKRGRKVASLTGAAVGFFAGLAAAYSITQASFVMLCLSTFMLGLFFSSVQQYRFAAADMAAPNFKARAISFVMLGGIASAILGPQTAILTRDLLAPIPYAGAFVGQAVLAACAFAALTFIASSEPTAAAKAAAIAADPPRPVSELIAQPRLLAAIVCGLVSYGLMSFVMTAAPLAMVSCGLSTETAWWGIQWHILGMYVPAFFTGHLIDRFGKVAITVLGLLLLLVSAAIALSGLETLHFWSSLILLGVGWNFGFVGATALVTDCYRPSERGTVQTINDFSVFGTVAIASFASGQILNAGGWTVVNTIMFPAVGVALIALVVNSRLKTVKA